MGKKWSSLASSGNKTPHTEDFQSQLVRLESSEEEYERAYEEGETLGEGITGCVKEVVHLASGKRYAMKSINLDRIDKAQIKELKTEIGILKQLDHPNIVRLHEVYQSKTNIRIIMELLTGGDLAQRRLETEESIRRVIFQLVSACRYWHSRGVVHRDLKLENVMFVNSSHDSDVKVIDFGLGTTFFSDQLREERMHRRRADSDKYLSAKTLVASLEQGLSSPRLKGLRLRQRTTSSRNNGHSSIAESDSELMRESSDGHLSINDGQFLSPSPAFSPASLPASLPPPMHLPPPLSIGVSANEAHPVANNNSRAPATVLATAQQAQQQNLQNNKVSAKSQEPTSSKQDNYHHHHHHHHNPNQKESKQNKEDVVRSQQIQPQQHVQHTSSKDKEVKDDHSPSMAFKIASEKLRKGSIATVAKVKRSALGSPGSRKFSSRRNVTKTRMFQTTCGTAYYMAPEIMFGRGYTEKCDLWAIGVLTYMLIARRPPFPGKDEKEVFYRVRTCNPSFHGRSWERASPEVCEFCKKLLTVNPSLRWTAEEALASAWLSGVNEEEVDQAQSTLDTERAVILSMKRFASYPTLKRAALMIVSHNASSFQDAKLNHCFLTIDQSNLGYITRGDLCSFIMARDSTATEEMVNTIFESMDQGRSGHIRYMGFLAATIEKDGPVSDEMVELAFQHFELDKHGAITQRSLKRLLGRGYAKRDVAKIIAETSADCNISFETFKTMMKDTPPLRSGSRVLFDEGDAALGEGYAHEEEFDDDVYYDALFVDSESDVYDEVDDDDDMATPSSPLSPAIRSLTAHPGYLSKHAESAPPTLPMHVTQDEKKGDLNDNNGSGRLETHHEEHNPDPRFLEAREYNDSDIMYIHHHLQKRQTKGTSKSAPTSPSSPRAV